MILMNINASYVTQQSLWSVHIGKPLTNRRIAQLQKEGFYSDGVVRAEAQTKKRKAVSNRKIDALFAGL